MNNNPSDIFVGVGKNYEDEVPMEAWFAAAESAIEGEKSILQTNRELADAFEQIRAGFKDDLSSYTKNIGGYSDFHKKIKERLSEIPSLLPQSREGEKLKLDFKQRLLADSQQFIGSSGIEVKKIEALQKAYISRLNSAIDEILEIKDDKERAQVHTDTVSLPKATSNPWTWYQTPYADAWSDWWWQKSAGSSWANSSANRITGEINCWSGLSLNGADDSDYSWANSRAE